MMIKYLFCIYFRVGAWGAYQWTMQSKRYERFSFLLPPKFWCDMMCKLGKHDYDLAYSGPDASMVECMDCNWTIQSSRDKKTGVVITRKYYRDESA